MTPDYWTRDSLAAEETLLSTADSRFPALAKRTRSAIELAKRLHRGQIRKGGGSYIAHPLRVALAILNEFRYGDHDVLVAAILHDVLEDSPYAPQKLREEFGGRVADLVCALTRQAGEERPAGGDRIDSPYFIRLAAAGDGAILLKCADKLDNLRDALYLPNAGKRRVLVEEVETVYLELTAKLQDRTTGERAIATLESAAELHTEASLSKALFEAIAPAPSGIELDLPEALLGQVDRYRLLNPILHRWVIYDHALVALDQDTRQLAAHVARLYGAAVKEGRAQHILDLAGFPGEAKAPKSAADWTRIASQFELLAELLTVTESPEWLRPATATRSLPWLLSLSFSLMLKPANWLSPVWHADLGAALGTSLVNDPFRCFPHPDGPEAVRQFLGFLLSHREALIGVALECGTVARLEMAAANLPATGHPEVWWSLRFLSEYLDAATSAAGAEPGALGALWERMSAVSFNVSGLLETGPGVELPGLREVRCLFERNKRLDLDWIVAILAAHCRNTNSKDRSWVYFDLEEFAKRPEIFANDVPNLAEGENFGRLEEFGIETSGPSTNGPFVIRVFPSRQLGLRNRLPEIETGDIKFIHEEAYAATAIFDQLILNRTEALLWLPRTYRVLDTMSDLDPGNVQEVRVTLTGPEDSTRIRAWLPLPREKESTDRQGERKKRFARYLAAQIYSVAVTRRVVTANISCAAVGHNRESVGLTVDELLKLLRAAETDLGYRPIYSSYAESFSFSPFRIEGRESGSETPFGTADVRFGLYLGIDIGGTRVKVVLFRDGRPVPQRNGEDTLSFYTQMSGARARLTSETVEDFCLRILHEIRKWMLYPANSWAELSGIGVSWPGAVREARIVCYSGTLEYLEYRGQRLRKDSPAEWIHSFPFLEIMADSVARIAGDNGWHIDPALSFALENDGNAEAFGNYCALLLEGEGAAGGKLIVKLGTSLAGARITPGGSVATEVAEFSKVILRIGEAVTGIAKEFVSSLGVRKLAREFRFPGPDKDAPLLFGNRTIEKDYLEESPKRIEAIDVGLLLMLVVDNEWPGWEAYRKRLVETDNHPGEADERVLEHLLTTWQSQKGAVQLKDWIDALGTSWWQRRNPDLPLLRPAEIETLGEQRATWLVSGHEDGPFDIRSAELARLCMGAMALFSQLGLHMAHLIAGLYNIYRRGSFSEVILAGGVLGGTTGPLVKEQTERFLLKYYDKIYGPGKNLLPGAIRLSHYPNRDAVGPFGAAMLANRAHKETRLALLRSQLDLAIREMAPGETFRVEDLDRALRGPGASGDTLKEISDYLRTLLESSTLVSDPDGRSYVKPVQ